MLVDWGWFEAGKGIFLSDGCRSNIAAITDAQDLGRSQVRRIVENAVAALLELPELSPDKVPEWREVLRGYRGGGNGTGPNAQASTSSTGPNIEIDTETESWVPPREQFNEEDAIQASVIEQALECPRKAESSLGLPPRKVDEVIAPKGVRVCPTKVACRFRRPGGRVSRFDPIAAAANSERLGSVIGKTASSADHTGLGSSLQQLAAPRLTRVPELQQTWNNLDNNAALPALLMPRLVTPRISEGSEQGFDQASEVESSDADAEEFEPGVLPPMEEDATTTTVNALLFMDAASGFSVDVFGVGQAKPALPSADGGASSQDPVLAVKSLDELGKSSGMSGCVDPALSAPQLTVPPSAPQPCTADDSTMSTATGDLGTLSELASLTADNSQTSLLSSIAGLCSAGPAPAEETISETHEGSESTSHAATVTGGRASAPPPAGLVQEAAAAGDGPQEAEQVFFASPPPWWWTPEGLSAAAAAAAKAATSEEVLTSIYARPLRRPWGLPAAGQRWRTQHGRRHHAAEQSTLPPVVPQEDTPRSLARSPSLATTVTATSAGGVVCFAGVPPSELAQQQQLLREQQQRDQQQPPHQSKRSSGGSSRGGARRGLPTPRGMSTPGSVRLPPVPGALHGEAERVNDVSSSHSEATRIIVIESPTPAVGAAPFYQSGGGGIDHTGTGGAGSVGGPQSLHPGIRSSMLDASGHGHGVRGNGVSSTPSTATGRSPRRRTLRQGTFSRNAPAEEPLLPPTTAGVLQRCSKTGKPISSLSHEPVDEAIMLRCGHNFSLSQLSRAISTARRPDMPPFLCLTCPICGNSDSKCETWRKIPEALNRDIACGGDAKKYSVRNLMKVDWQLCCDLPMNT